MDRAGCTQTTTTLGSQSESAAQIMSIQASQEKCYSIRIPLAPTAHLPVPHSYSILLKLPK